MRAATAFYVTDCGPASINSARAASSADLRDSSGLNLLRPVMV